MYIANTCNYQRFTVNTVHLLYKLTAGAQPEIFQGRRGLGRLEHFYKHFVKITRKKIPQEKILESFLLDTLKTTFWVENLTQKLTQSVHFSLNQPPPPPPLPICVPELRVISCQKQINRLLVVMHHENKHELASLRFLNLNLDWQYIEMGKKTYEDLFFFLSWDYVLNHHHAIRYHSCFYSCSLF